METPKITPAMADKMSKHALSCKYEGAGGWSVGIRTVGYVLQTGRPIFDYVLKCAGCGHSIEYKREK